MTTYITCSHVIHLAAPPARVFPLFEPEGEKAWAADWQPEYIHPASGAAAVGTTFMTQHAGESQTLWAIAMHDPAIGFVRYVRLTPGSRIGIITVECAAGSQNATDARVTYQLTALSAAGEHELEAFAAHFQQYMAEWETAINHFLAHGNTTSHHV
jgi:hypothetical protein